MDRSFGKSNCVKLGKLPASKVANQIAQMTKDFERISSLVTVVNGQNPGPFTLNGTNTYLVGAGDEKILIDTGDGRDEYLKILIKSMESTKTKKLKCILITHWHLDHIGGVSSILKTFDYDIPVYKYITCNEKRNDEVSYLHIEDGMKFECEGVTLKAILMPGHAEDQVCFHLLQENSLFCGDNILGSGSGVFEDLTEYIKSLQRTKEMNLSALYTGHGIPCITDVHSKMNEYISHRQKRINQVKHILAMKPDQPMSCEEITKEVYKGQILNDQLLFAAQSNTQKVLDHLLILNQVLADGDKKMWRICNLNKI